jgi:hypothetical protein
MEDIINFIEFAIEDSTCHHDFDGNPIIDVQRMKEIMSEYITKREAKMKKQIIKEAKEAIQKILL